MRLQGLSLGRQGAVHVHALLQQSVEHGDQRDLVVVPPQAELLVVVHGASRAAPFLRQSHANWLALASTRYV